MDDVWKTYLKVYSKWFNSSCPEYDLPAMPVNLEDKITDAPHEPEAKTPCET